LASLQSSRRAHYVPAHLDLHLEFHYQEDRNGNMLQKNPARGRGKGILGIWFLPDVKSSRSSSDVGRGAQFGNMDRGKICEC